MKPAARVTDPQMCPAQSATLPPVPHVGGRIEGPGNATVLIADLPAAMVGDVCVCSGGPPSILVSGSGTVLIGNLPMVRFGDSTDHGGTVVSGEPTVLIGD